VTNPALVPELVTVRYGLVTTVVQVTLPTALVKLKKNEPGMLWPCASVLVVGDPWVSVPAEMLRVKVHDPLSLEVSATEPLTV
jgi:hypothetical protein